MIRKRTNSSLRLENLESRHMMAGDVMAFTSAKTLYVLGDNASNGVALVDDGSGNVNVIGLEQDGSETLINGDTNQVFSKVKNIVIVTGTGDDAVVVADLTVKGSLTITTEGGDDAIGLGGYLDPDDLFDDAVDSLLSDLTVKGPTTINAGGGDNNVIMDDATINSVLTIVTGIGDNTIELGVTSPVTVKGVVTIATSIGNDTVNLNGLTTTKELVVSTSVGNDEVTLTDVTAKYVTVALGPGDDEVTVEDTTVRKTAVFDGSTGDNIYNDAGGNSFGNLIRTNFQTIT
jgi:hypothetical protein